MGVEEIFVLNGSRVQLTVVGDLATTALAAKKQHSLGVFRAALVGGLVEARVCSATRCQLKLGNSSCTPVSHV